MIRFKFKRIPDKEIHKFFNSEELLPIKDEIYNVFGDKATVDDVLPMIFEDYKVKVEFLLIKYPQYFELVNENYNEDNKF